MAKIKVHELAKELDKQSKEIIAFLQEKGVEAKAAQSTIEDDAVAMVRNHFGAKSENQVKEAPVQEKTETPAQETKTETAPVASASEDAPKKKKKIIFVSNPQNSRVPGQQGNRPQGNANNNQNRNQNNSQNKNFR